MRSWTWLITAGTALTLAAGVALAAGPQGPSPPASDGMFVPDPSLDDEQIPTDEQIAYLGTYFIWTRGRISGRLDIGLNPARRYLITGALTGKAGGDYAQIYISRICRRRSPDQVLCEVEDEPPGSPSLNVERLGIHRIVEGATQVTLTLRGDGGFHRAEGTVFNIGFAN